MSNPTKQIIVQLDDDRVLEYDSENSQFLLAEKVITNETALRHFIDQGIAEPFGELFRENVEKICSFFRERFDS